jgi:hypothetical protein
MRLCRTRFSCIYAVYEHNGRNRFEGDAFGILKFHECACNAYESGELREADLCGEDPRSTKQRG